DRKSTRLNSSHVKISYAVFCLKKKSASVHRIKMKGDKGSTWRRPLSGTIFPLGCLFIRTLNFTEVMHLIIHPIQVYEKPIFLITYSMNDHSILSYAFLISVFIFLLILRPPRSTLFPYTTLFR